MVWHDRGDGCEGLYSIAEGREGANLSDWCFTAFAAEGRQATQIIATLHGSASIWARGKQRHWRREGKRS